MLYAFKDLNQEQPTSLKGMHSIAPSTASAKVLYRQMIGRPILI